MPLINFKRKASTSHAASQFYDVIADLEERLVSFSDLIEQKFKKKRLFFHSRAEWFWFLLQSGLFSVMSLRCTQVENFNSVGSTGDKILVKIKLFSGSGYFKWQS